MSDAVVRVFGRWLMALFVGAGASMMVDGVEGGLLTALIGLIAIYYLAVFCNRLR